MQARSKLRSAAPHTPQAVVYLDQTSTPLREVR